MTHRQTFGIVGGGLAGAGAAATLRSEGFEGRIVLVSDELWAPYERPPLTKSYLAGASTAKEAYIHPEGFYRDQDIDLLSGVRATQYSPATGELELDDSTSVRCDALLLASGSAARPLNLAGSDADNVLTIRTLSDAHRARERLTSGARVVCIGSGWIGMEIAATARGRGCDVTVVAPGDVPLSGVLGSELGRIYQRVHESEGVTFRMCRHVRGLNRSIRETTIELDNGERLAADVLIVGIGSTARVSMLADAGATLDLGGIATDAMLRASLPNVFAAGDVAAAQHPLYQRRVRVEHWANALHQGRCAARNMLGAEEEYARLPYFYSDQYHLSMEYAGYASGTDRMLLRGDPSSASFAAFWVDANGGLLAGMTINQPGVIDNVEALLRYRWPVDLDVLADPSAPLELAMATVRRDRPS